MANYKYKYDELKERYNSFQIPMVKVYISGTDFSTNKCGFGVSTFEVENTCGFEASIATFKILNVFDMVRSLFRFEELKPYIALGSTVVIMAGYSNTVREIFRGFISSVDFTYYQGESPGVTVTCMDIKGIMMSGTYVKQLTAMSYSDAVTEILKKTNYTKLQSAGASGMGGLPDADDYSSMITQLDIKPTPDKDDASTGGQGSGSSAVTDKSIEMVAESDYEFVVKAAKKFNFEFFTLGGIVYFRKAKSNEELLMELGANTGLIDLDVNYDITGLASKVEVRDIDAGQGTVISAELSLNNKISNGKYAKGLISGVEKVVIDPTVRSKSDAENRAKYLMEDISYRLGTLNATFLGLPEISPGRFIVLNGLGEKYKVKFYLYSVRHIFDTEDGYTTKIIGKGASVDAV